MKKMNVLIATAIVALSVSATSCDSKKSANLKSAVDSASYSIGVANGAMFKESLANFPGEKVNVDILLAAFETALKGDSAGMKITPEEAQNYLQTYFMEAQVKEGAVNKEKGDKFLADNKTKSGVITTESGLQYKVVTEGTGAKPTAEDVVRVKYTGKTLDGVVFDSTDKQGGQPAEFQVGGVIKGWTEGLQTMPVGSKYIFWIPAELAYGDRPAGPDIKANSTLEFEVELLEIVKQ